MNPRYTDEELEIERLEQKIIRLERRVRELEAQRQENSWRANPDRSGGAYTQDEIAHYSSWK